MDNNQSAPAISGPAVEEAKIIGSEFSNGDMLIVNENGNVRPASYQNALARSCDEVEVLCSIPQAMIIEGQVIFGKQTGRLRPGIAKTEIDTLTHNILRIRWNVDSASG